MRSRLAYRSKITGVVGRGNFTTDIKLIKVLVIQMNIKYNDTIVHWEETEYDPMFDINS